MVKPFRRDETFWARIPQVGKLARPRSLDVKDPAVARNICEFLGILKNRGEQYLLEEMAEGRVRPMAAYLAWVRDKLPQFIEETKRVATDRDLLPYVALWHDEMVRVNTPNAVSRKKYLSMIATLISSPFPASRLDKHTVREWLASRRSTAPKATNKYRSALSSFCNFLVDAEILEHNPVMDVKAAKPSDPRERYLEQDDVRRVLNALSGEARAYHALSACTALETQALVRLRRADIDTVRRTVLARATKNRARSRTTTVYKRWFWAWEIVLQHLNANPMLPDSPVFTIKADKAYNDLKDACADIGIKDFRVHDWRHVWAVQAVRDGLAIQTVSHQLGHSNGAITLRVYAKYIPTAADFERTIIPDDTISRTADLMAVGGMNAN